MAFWAYRLFVAVVLAGFSVVPAAAQYNLYYGNFHAHCNLSNDATGPLSGPPSVAYAYARDTAGIDVLALTDHSHYLTTSEYNTLQTEANNFTQNGVFVAIAAQEHGSLSTSVTGAFGHINVWEYASIINQSTYRYNLPGTYSFIASNVDDTIGAGLVGGFNHPYSSGGAGIWAQFKNLEYDATGDQGMQFIEVLNGKRSSSYEQEYFEALAKGWHVGALGNQDNHAGSWGDQVNNNGNIPLTGIWAPQLTKGDILQAMGARRTFAMEVEPADDRMSIKLTADGNWMGGEYSTSADSVDFVVEVSAVNDIASITLFRNATIIQTIGVGSASFTWVTHDTPGPGDFYYLVRINQADGDRAWSSPIWIESTSTFSQPISAINEDNPDGTPTQWFQTATVQGLVTVDTDTLDTVDNRFFIQDATGGLLILDSDVGSQPVTLGDNVLITGLVNLEKGQTFIDPNPGAIQILGAGAPPPAATVTTNDVATNGEALEGSLVQILNVSITSGTWPLPGSNGVVTIDDGSGPCDLFIDKDTSLDDLGAPSEPTFSVRGILTQDDVAPPFDCCYRIMPRYEDDFFDAANDVIELPAHFSSGTRLHQNHPNPFRPSTTVRFELGGASEQPVRLDIFDVNGRLVRTLIDGSLPRGSFEVGWDGRSSAGQTVAAGVYFYRLRAGTVDETRKMVLLK